jgi:hypothetical protein
MVYGYAPHWTRRREERGGEREGNLEVGTLVALVVVVVLNSPPVLQVLLEYKCS